jgi:hypothetical protein
MSSWARAGTDGVSAKPALLARRKFRRVVFAVMINLLVVARLYHFVS